MSPTERPWVVPDECWDSADGGVSRVRKNTPKSRALRETTARSTKEWLTETPVSLHRPGAWGSSPHDPAVVSPPADTLSHRKPTPQTEDSTPFKENEPSKDAIPLSYVKAIVLAFGHNPDLYSDVLCVNRRATQREIRIAYFRRGREVLAEHKTVPGAMAAAAPSATINGAVSNSAKVRFQAVSMAYDILSTPAWRTLYDTSGLRGHHSDDDGWMFSDENNENEECSPSSKSVVSAHSRRCRSSSAGRSRTRSASQNGVRWNEEVEEVLFDQHPGEVSFKSEDYDETDESGRPRRKKKNRKSKARIVVENEALQDHLAKLDEEADQHLVSDFLDDLEQSIDELISMASSRGEKAKKYFRRTVYPQKELFPEDDLEPKGDESPRTSPKQKKEASTALERARKTLRKVLSLSPTRKGSIGGTAQTDAPEKTIPLPAKQVPTEDPWLTSQPRATMFHFDTPPDIILKKKSKTDATYDDTTVSSLSTFMAQKEAQRQRQLQRTQEEEKDSFNKTGICDQGSSLPRTAGKCTPSMEPNWDSWCGHIAESSPTRPLLRDAPSSQQTRNPESPENLYDPQYFHIHLLAYLKAVSEDLCKWGNSVKDMDWSVVEAVTISEDDLEGMLDVLHTEMEVIPPDILEVMEDCV